MIQCEFCPEQFEYQDEYEAHLKIQHPEEYRALRAKKEIEEFLKPAFSRIIASQQSSTATELTKLALEHDWTAEQVVNYYRRVLALLQEEEESRTDK